MYEIKAVLNENFLYFYSFLLPNQFAAIFSVRDYRISAYG